MKNSIKIIISLLLVVIFTFSFSGCNKDKEDEDGGKSSQTSKEARDIRLPYSQEDTLNPYVAQSQINQNLFPLIYSSLFYLDGSYEAQPQVAQSGTSMGNVVSVMLNSNGRFADGTYIDSADIVYSFNLAKQSSYYSQSLINISKAEAKGSLEVEFTLVVPDVYALSCLDFPIVKDGTKVDGTEGEPIASGKYYVAAEGTNKYLEVNKHYEGYSPVRSKIELVNITDSNAIIYSLVIGNIDSLFCNLSSGTYERINASTTEVLMNNFIFLGINNYSTKLSDPILRQSINAVIDREKIINEGFQGYAKAAYTPFNPNWYALDSVKQPGKDVKKDEALKYISDNAKNLSLNLVINADNPFKKSAGQIIASQLQSAGIKVNVSELGFNAYNAAVSAGSYDLYLGEIRLTDNMNIYPMLTDKNTSYAFYQQLSDGTITMQEFLDNFYSELPFVPICYRKGVLAFSRDISVEVKSFDNDVYANIGEWVLNK